ncbi:hypothetical protein M569_11993, partial [Genlisea aurea]
SAVPKFLFYAFFACSALAAVSGVQFQVGEKLGWRKPNGHENETYNEWAGKNRFRIGDSLHFKYSRKDSVLEVDSGDYKTCNASNPIGKFDGGDTIFEFDRSGSFYFISGQSGHCEAGQKLIVRVMHTEIAPSPSEA